MTKEEREQKQRKRLDEMQEFERDLRKQGISLIAGIDEVGRGPLAGPVVAACVVLPEDFDVLGVDDSKKLSEKKRESLYDEILSRAVCYGIGSVDNETIDEINILQATRRAMKQAVEEAESMLGRPLEHLLIDALKLEDVPRPQTSIIKGDARSLSIAAASIVAKVYRDRLMVEYSSKYPGYAFEKNKGYGTKAHYEGIREQGTCPIHRMSFLKNLH